VSLHTFGSVVFFLHLDFGFNGGGRVVIALFLDELELIYVGVSTFVREEFWLMRGVLLHVVDRFFQLGQSNFLLLVYLIPIDVIILWFFFLNLLSSFLYIIRNILLWNIRLRRFDIRISHDWRNSSICLIRRSHILFMRFSNIRQRNFLVVNLNFRLFWNGRLVASFLFDTVNWWSDVLWRSFSLVRLGILRTSSKIRNLCLWNVTREMLNFFIWLNFFKQMAFHDCFCCKSKVVTSIVFIGIIHDFCFIDSFLVQFKFLVSGSLFLLSIVLGFLFLKWWLFFKIWSLLSVYCDFWHLRQIIRGSWTVSSWRSKYLRMLLGQEKFFLSAFVAIAQISSHLVYFTKVFHAKFVPIAIIINSFSKHFQMLTFCSWIMIGNSKSHDNVKPLGLIFLSLFFRKLFRIAIAFFQTSICCWK